MKICRKTMQDTQDDDGSWMVLPTPKHAAAHATPFPDFDADGEWRVGEAVHDLTIEHMVRITEREGGKHE